jgi:DUF971 family protein
MIDIVEEASPAEFGYDDRTRSLVVTWTDGQTLPITFAELRRNCPCAECIGEGGSAGRFATRPDLVPGEDELADIALVGRYGLNVIWADGHRTGIYTFEKLRELGKRMEVQAS